ncbi:MAG: nitronate monooxygenase family protein [Chloroflexota bacterium]|nr:nitronate monooxygenase family protein [Chloroflexota bacterium]
MFKTKITEMLGIKYPIIQGGMQWVSRAELVSAVSNAGGLGILSALTFPSPEELAAEIKKTKDLTDKPFGVNITILPTLRPVNYDAYIDAISQGGVKIVETAGRSPEPYMKRFKTEGIKIIHKCTAVRFAQTAQRVGCDVISIDGFECAGHPGEEDMTSLILIPRTVDSVDIPVVASGGFGDGRGLVAALALGASAVNMGTRFLATQESPAHPQVKERLVQSSERDTVLIQRSLRNTVRVLRNAASENVSDMEKRGATLEELAPFISGEKGFELLQTGDMDRGLVSFGQVVGLIHHIPTVKQLIEDIIHEAEEITSRFSIEGVFQPLRKPS